MSHSGAKQPSYAVLKLEVGWHTGESGTRRHEVELSWYENGTRSWRELAAWRQEGPVTEQEWSEAVTALDVYCGRGGEYLAIEEELPFP